jgi:hypothetical protein
MAHVRRKAAFYRERGIEVEELDASALAAAEPHLSDQDSPERCAFRQTAPLTRSTRRVFSSNSAARGPRGGKASRRLRWARPVETPREAGPRSSSSTRPESRRRSLDPGLPIAPRKGHLVITDRYPDSADTSWSSWGT